MKTSNLLLLALLALVLLSMVGANLSLKSEFEKIDRNDPFLGYTRDTLPPFKYIKLTGQPVGLVQIQPGPAYELRDLGHDIVNQKYSFNWQMSGDTLVVSQRLGPGGRQIPFRLHEAFAGKPYVYIMAPAILGIVSEHITTRVQGWPGGVVSLVQRGHALLLSANQFEQVELLVSAGAHAELDATNHLGTTTVHVQDSSRLVVGQPAFDSFRVQVDSTAHIDLPGNLLKKTL